MVSAFFVIVWFTQIVISMMCADRTKMDVILLFSFEHSFLVVNLFQTEKIANVNVWKGFS